MYRNLADRLKAPASGAASRGRGRLVRFGSALPFALVMASATPAWAATVEIRCARLFDAAKGELEARARLFLTSADMEGATIALECDADNAWLIWVDGSKTLIDPRTNMVEGTLDAIEDRIARAKRAAPPASSSANASSGEPPPAVAEGGGAPKGVGVEPGADEASLDRLGAPAERSSGIDLEGGVGLAFLTEFWSGAYAAGVGPRLDVGVGVGRKISIVISEGARFAVGSGAGQMMTFDLQVGAAYGASGGYRQSEGRRASADCVAVGRQRERQESLQRPSGCQRESIPQTTTQ